MHILATDLLTCPRCGPDFGLILMADVLIDRRVIEGSLGCLNCRDGYPISGGVADLRHASSDPLEPVERTASGEAATDRGFRLAALLGVNTPNATILVLDSGGELATRVAEVLETAHVIGVSPLAPRKNPSGGGVSAVLAGIRIPVRSHSVRGVAIADLQVAPLLEEAARVLMPGARVVLDPAPGEAAARLRDLGFQLRLEQDGIVVADAPRPR
jgi:uncharacterized protein YbaR (Trm112 family)